MTNAVSFTASIAELAHRKKSCTQSLTQLIWCSGNQSFCFNSIQTIQRLHLEWPALEQLSLQHGSQCVLGDSRQRI